MTTTKPVDSKVRQKAIHNITVYGMLMDLVLSFTKIVSGYMVSSTALVADGIHSFSDMLTDILVLIINRFSHEDPDEEHAYGHARFETAGTLILGIILFLLGASMAFEYGQELLQQQISTLPSQIGIVVVILSIVGKEWQFRFTMKVAKKVNSSLLEANAWHSRTDSISSIVVLIGLGATIAGYPVIEILAAIFVAFLIGRMGFKMASDAIQELMDKGLTHSQQELLKNTLKSVPGIVSVHMLRTRRMANQIFLDAHIQVASRISVSEGHQINEYAMSRLREFERDIRDITLHIDHEPDDSYIQLKLAPQRREIENFIKQYPELAAYRTLIIHYINQSVELDICFDKLPTDEIKHQCRLAIENANWLSEIRLSQQHQTFQKGANDSV